MWVLSCPSEKVEILCLCRGFERVFRVVSLKCRCFCYFPLELLVLSMTINLIARLIHLKFCTFGVDDSLFRR